MHSPFSIDDVESDFPTADDLALADRGARKRRQPTESRSTRRPGGRLTRPPRNEADQAFKCGRCKQFIGAPLTGGKHRNHCPNCLYSRHVDDSRPGDRRSDCHAMMAPIGILSRRNGEQVILHRCLGCGKADPNRIAADDNPPLLLTLRPVSPAGLTVVPDPDIRVQEHDEETA